VPSRSRQSGSRYRPAPVHLCPDPVPVPQTELTPSLINFTTPTADWCPRSGGGWLFNETQACLVTVLSSVWDGESGKWQSVNNGGTIETSVLEAHRTNHNILSRYRNSRYRCYCRISRKGEWIISLPLLCNTLMQIWLKMT